MEEALAAEKALNGLEVQGAKIMAKVEKRAAVQRRVKAKKKEKPSVKPIMPIGEIETLRKRFGAESVTIDSDTEFTMHVPPRDPATFPYDLTALVIKATVPPDYPSSILSLSVQNMNFPESLRLSIKKRVEDRARAAYKDKEMIVGLFTFIQNNLEKLMIDTEINRNYQLQSRGVEVFAFANEKNDAQNQEGEKEKHPEKGEKLIAVIPRREIEEEENFLKMKPEKISVPVKEEQDESESETESASAEEHSEEEEDEGLSPPSQEQSALSAETAHRGTQITCTTLEMEQVAVLQCHTLHAQITCTKCKTKADVSLSANVPFTSLCSQCQSPYAITFRSAMMHENSKIWGYLDIEGTNVFDILPSSFNVTCLECGETSLVKRVALGVHLNYSCQKCFKVMRLLIDGIRLSKVRIGKALSNVDLAEIEKRKKAKQHSKDTQGIRRGQPLPNHGTCKHYRKSYRWLRFPCCNKAYPCDICHDDASDHPVEWAKRMICGFCAAEQAYSASANCSSCKADLTGHSSTAFWEGGEGTRNKTRMSKKDPHKYAGLGKTISKKKRSGGGKH